MSKSGIYCIRCLANGKIYVGSAFNLARRLSNHRSDLRKNRHANLHLQRCFNAYGQESLIYEVIELVPDVSLLLVREQYYIDHYQSHLPDSGLNILPKAGSRIGRKASDATKRKLSEAWKRRKVRFPISPETCAKISASNKGRKMSSKAKAALALNNAARVRDGVSEETVQKLKDAWVRRKQSPDYTHNLKKPEVSQDNVAKIVHYYKEGFTSTQIASIVNGPGCSAGNIRIILKRNGVELRPKFSRPNPTPPAP